jgi:fatty-acyl-CoA synthase
MTVGALFRSQVEARAEQIALQHAASRLTYGELDRRVNRLARALAARGAQRGERVAVLSENRSEYVEIELACAKLGAIAACQNWRQADPELEHCIRLVRPKVLLVSARFMPVAARIRHGCDSMLAIDEGYEAALNEEDDAPLPDAAQGEDGLIILYTSGTTGLPKAAVISHRAVIARAAVHEKDRPTAIDDAFVAWTPMFHMGATDFLLATLLRGGKVIVMDGFDPAGLARLVESEKLGWLHVMPGTTERFIAELRRRGCKPRGVRFCGVMPDLVPRALIGELTRLLGAPYPNTFGSTEAGSMLSRDAIPAGEVPLRLSKRQSSLCEVRLVDEYGAVVPDGEPGELEVRGPALFSGYWDESTASPSPVLRDGWFATGDVFVRNADGSFDFVDRRKYVIKSGGENIYPAEIERVLNSLPDIAEAVVVRRSDATWGEVPVAFVVPRKRTLTVEEVLDACRGRIARYKLPKEVYFLSERELPRSISGKVLRQELEARLRRKEQD